MFAVFDTLENKLDADQYGHVKVYSTEKAARRRAQSHNTAVYPRMNRFGTIKVNLSPEIVWGKPNYKEC